MELRDILSIQVLSEYLDFLCKHRGLIKNTIRFRKNDVISFLKSLRLENELENIGKISATQVYIFDAKITSLLDSSVMWSELKKNYCASDTYNIYFT